MAGSEPAAPAADAEASFQVHVRRTEAEDIEGVVSLISRSRDTWLQHHGLREDSELPDLARIAEHALLAVTALDENDVIIGHAAFTSFPVLGTDLVSASDWGAWMARVFGQGCPVGPHNSVCLSVLVADPYCQDDVLQACLRTAVSAIPDLHYFLLACRANAPLPAPARRVFARMSPEATAATGNGAVSGDAAACDLHVCLTSDVIPEVVVRDARVEDHDDLLPVVRAQSGNLAQRYGKFFLAELISSQDAETKTLVAEYEHRAVGIMGMTSAVDYDALQQAFDLEPYDNLLRVVYPEAPKKKSRNRRTRTPGSKTGVRSATPEATMMASVPEDEAISSAVFAAPSADDAEAAAQLAPGDAGAPADEPAAQLADEDNGDDADDDEGGDDDDDDNDDEESTNEDPTQRMMRMISVISDESAGGGAAASESVFKAGPAVAAAIAPSTSPDLASLSPSPDPAADTTEADAAVAATTAAAAAAAVAASCNAPAVPTAGSEGTGSGGNSAATSRLAQSTPDVFPNAFAVTLFCIDEEHEASARDFLAAAFARFPDKQYCIIMLPHSADEFPLLRSLTQIPPRHGVSTAPHVLYLVHRHSLMHPVQVRLASPDDYRGVQRLVDGLKDAEDLLDDFAISQRDGLSLVVEAAEQIVGCVVLSEPDNLVDLHGSFAVDNFVVLSLYQRQQHAFVQHLQLNPIFVTKTRHVLREVMRVADRPILYTWIPSKSDNTDDGDDDGTASGDDDATSPGTSAKASLPFAAFDPCLREFVPVPPRRQIQRTAPVTGDGGFAHRPVSSLVSLGGLGLLASKLVHEPRIQVNSRVLVVGGADVAVSLLHSLCFVPYLSFTHVTLVSPAGLPVAVAPTQLRQWRPQSLLFHAQDMSLMAMQARIAVVRGHMLSIDRQTKSIALDAPGAPDTIAYDYLVLTTGQQDTSIERLPVDQQLYDGAFTLKNQLEVDRVAAYVLRTGMARRDSSAQAVVFGSTLDAYAAVQGLLSSGVPPQRITLVAQETGDGAALTACNDPRIDRRISGILDSLGITLATARRLRALHAHEETSRLARVTFDAANGESLVLPASLLLCTSARKVSNSTFQAVNASSLVYDGHLMISHEFTTNDPCIYAGGTMTRFSRRYRSTIDFAQHNARQVGEHLAESLLKQLDPVYDRSSAIAGNLSSSDGADAEAVPVFDAPIFRFAVLPGGYYYFHAGPSGPTVPLSVAQKEPTFGKALVTDHDDKYFRLHIDQYEAVAAITYFGRTPIELQNMQALLGLPQQLLNRVAERFADGLIKDFVAYFRQPWSAAVYHDRLPDLLAQIRHVVDLGNIAQQVSQLAEAGASSVSGSKHSDLLDQVDAGSQRRIQQLVMQFVQDNDHHLPEYFNNAA